MVEFWSNSHIQIHVQLIVVGDKRPGHRSPWDDVHHGSFNLKDREKHFLEVLTSEALGKAHVISPSKS